jgi:mRNA interferase RelE/StbE
MYKIEYTIRALKDIENLPVQVARQISVKLTILANNPFVNQQVKALRGERGGYRLRVGDYRVVYYIENEVLIITVVRIGHRKDIYQ